MNIKERYIVFITGSFILIFTLIQFHKQNVEIQMAIKSFDQLSVEFDENEIETPDDSNNQIEKPFHESHTFDKRRKAIVLITMYRAGSTFFGELFNQNPEIFYHFEPLTLFGYDKPNMEHKLRMLKEIIVDCRSPKYSEYSEFAFNDTTTQNVCGTENHCFWFNSQRFCQPPFCRVKVKDHADTCRRPCYPGPANKQELLTSVCKTETKATAAKIIRIPDAEHIINLINDYKRDVDGKIIILVRDPRAMITSRRKIAMWDGLWKRDKESMLTQLKKECKMMTKNKELAKSYPELIQIIRYEDMSMEPIEQTSRIYDFIGMKISPEIEEFLKKSTTTQDLESNHRSDQKFMQIYTTSRNSKIAMNEWRSKIDKELFDRVQLDCETMMKDFGYKHYQSVEDLKRNLDEPYFTS